jgi:hypothetical protein
MSSSNKRKHANHEEGEMARSGSRTYKLRLSDQGIDLFLACHCRLARLVRDFIPYGATLSVAVLLLDRLGVEDIAAELETRACDQLAGDIERFVGCSNELANVMRRVVERLEASEQFGCKPPIGKLYIVGLVSFKVVEDGELTDAYRSTASRRAGRETEN